VARLPRAVRVKSPARPIRFDDLVHGPIAFDGALIEDFVILRSDGHPTYHLSVVADDVAMGMTHVVRGDDHISNTPKQVILYEALGAAVPQFAHVPLILGADKKRLSKRHGATSVMEYARQGYLPEAMVNFLALLGWSPGAGDREVFTRSDLVAAFNLRGISGGNAVFNVEKLDWFNQQHFWALSLTDLSELVKPAVEAAGAWHESFAGGRREWFESVLQLLKPRAKKVEDFVELGWYFFVDDVEYDEAGVAKHFKIEGMGEHLTEVDEVFARLVVFDAESTEQAVRAVAEGRQVKAASLIHALRLALTGRTASPGLFEVAVLLGRDVARRRITRAVGFLAESRG
jgi:glutamyl-tRNA synthetase